MCLRYDSRVCVCAGELLLVPREKVVEGVVPGSIPDKCGVRWSLVFGARRIGERVVFVVVVVGHIRLVVTHIIGI